MKYNHSLTYVHRRCVSYVHTECIYTYNVYFWVNILARVYNTYVTEFAKRGLIHASDVLTLRMCNSASVGPTALKFCGRTSPSLY